MILNKDYWSLRYELVKDSILYNINKINFISYLKKYNNIYSYLQQLTISITYYERLLIRQDHIDEHQTILKEKYDNQDKISDEINQIQKQIIETKIKLKNIKNRFDEMSYYDSLEVLQKQLKSLHNRSMIVEQQINQCQKIITKQNAILCESYFSQLALKKLKHSAYQILDTINYQYSQRNIIFYPFLSRFCKYVWFRKLYNI